MVSTFCRLVIIISDYAGAMALNLHLYLSRLDLTLPFQHGGCYKRKTHIWQRCSQRFRVFDPRLASLILPAPTFQSLNVIFLISALTGGFFHGRG